MKAFLRPRSAVLCWLAMIVLAMASPALLKAQTFCGAPLPPYIIFTSAVSGDYSASWTKRALYLSRSGRVALAGLGESHESELPGASQLACGLAPAGPWAALTQALGRVPLGAERDCFYDPPDAPIDWEFRIQWFGRPGHANTNQFLVSDRSVFPVCDANVQALIDQLQIFQTQFILSPTTQSLRSTP